MSGEDQQPPSHDMAQTVAVVVGKLEVMLGAVLAEVREMNTRLRGVENTQSSHEARISTLETDKKAAATRRPTWPAVLGACGTVLFAVLAILAFGDVIGASG